VQQEEELDMGAVRLRRVCRCMYMCSRTRSNSASARGSIHQLVEAAASVQVSAHTVAPLKNGPRVQLCCAISRFWAEEYLHIQGDRHNKYQYVPNMVQFIPGLRDRHRWFNT
jgi:hypothetical protein